jgi:hypothetical protein
MAYGPYLRTKPRVQVLSGYDPMNPTGLKQTAPVKSGVDILSGQAVVLEWNSGLSQYEWVLATRANVLGTLASGAPARTVYIAWQDSTDGDVVDGGLTGLSSSGDYEIQTAFFDAPTGDANYNADAVLTVSDTTPGNLSPNFPATVASGAALPIVGRITDLRGSLQLAQVGTVAPNQAASVIRKEDSSTLPVNSSVIRFRTSPGVRLVPAT